MKYRRLANTDVSEMALDTAACRVLSSDDFTELISTALESGINFFPDGLVLYVFFLLCDNFEV